MEGLLFAALAVEEQPAVGEGAIHIEARQADARGAGQHVIGQVMEVAEGHGQAEESWEGKRATLWFTPRGHATGREC